MHRLIPTLAGRHLCGFREADYYQAADAPSVLQKAFRDAELAEAILAKLTQTDDVMITLPTSQPDAPQVVVGHLLLVA